MALATASMVLTSCGGDDTPLPGPQPTTGTNACSLSQRQDWVFEQIDEAYLFPDLLAANVNPNNFGTVQAYIDALVEPAREQNRDRGFTFITSIEEENDLINNGSNAGFGVRFALASNTGPIVVLEAFEAGDAFAEGMDRGTIVYQIGNTPSTLVSVADLIAQGGNALNESLGPSDPGTRRSFEISNDGGTTRQVITVEKTEYSLDPISDRYGVGIINDSGRQVGYVNLRTFIVADAADQLRSAFGQFRAAGITEVIIDLRYNGGGLVSVANVFGDLLGRDKVGEVFSRTVFNNALSSNNRTDRFRSEPNAIAPTKIAFIGFSGTASASELLINSMDPYLGTDMALVGRNTFGKPVGQIARDRAECDDRLRVLAFQTNNADGEGGYYSGLASTLPVTCRASDDVSFQLGDPRENSIAEALNFLNNGPSVCTAITSGGQGTQSLRQAAPLQPLRPSLDQRTAAQHEMPGLY